MHLRVSVILAVIVAALSAACGADDASDTRTTATAPTPAVTGAAPLGSAGHATAAAPTTVMSTSTLSGELKVFAASSLTDAFGEIGVAFQKANPRVTVKFNFAASSALRTQLGQGARADIFASADQIQMDNARKANVIDGADQVFVKNKLVVIYPRNNPVKIATIKDLANPGVKLVLTDKAVPIGAYARTVLEKLSADPQYGADFGGKVLGNLRSEEANVRAVVTKVQLGEADAAIVYASDVTPAVSRDIDSILIPDQFNTIATYPIALVRDGGNKQAAQAFIGFVRSAQGQDILKKNNFIVDTETGAARAGPTGPTPLHAAGLPQQTPPPQLTSAPIRGFSQVRHAS